MTTKFGDNFSKTAGNGAGTVNTVYIFQISNVIT